MKKFFITLLLILISFSLFGNDLIINAKKEQKIWITIKTPFGTQITSFGYDIKNGDNIIQFDKILKRNGIFYCIIKYDNVLKPPKIIKVVNILK